MRKYGYILLVMILAAALGGCGREPVKETGLAERTETESMAPSETAGTTEQARKIQQSLQVEAVYLGVENYGAEETNKERKDDFRYRFQVGEREEVFRIENGEKTGGDYDYPIQNVLKEGSSYEITVEDGTVTKAEEIAQVREVSYEPPVSGTPGERTLKNFLSTALAPVGTVLYVYGGGWDWQDEGSSIQARTIGLSPDWIRFFDEQDENYTYRDKDGDEANRNPAASYYPYGGYNEYYYAGLDCSGYLGWALYNTFETESGNDGYVMAAADMAKSLSDTGWGVWTQDVSAADGSGETAVKPGDIMSIDGHVWISLGTCADGSVVIVHSTPTDSRSGQPGGGVQIGALGVNENCEAYCLADYYMSKYYSKWSERYETALKDLESYFSFTGDTAGLFSWDVMANGGLADPEGIQQMSALKMLTELFGEAPVAECF